MLPVDDVGDRTTEAVGAWTIAEALHDEAAGDCVKLGHAARMRDGAASDAAVHPYGERYADPPSYPGIAKVSRVVTRRDFARDLFKFGATAGTGSVNPVALA